MNKFIITNDNKIADKLRLMGFIQIPSNDTNFIFMNNNTIKINFNNIDKTKICFSNILHI